MDYENDGMHSSTNELYGVDFEHLGLLDKSRLMAQVPAYESTHMRHYLTDWDQYQRNQPEIRDGSKLRKNLTIHLKQQLEHLNAHERIELTMDSITELGPVMEEMRRNSLKYSMLLNRLNGKEVDKIIQGSLKVDMNKNSESQTHIQQYS